MSRTVRPANHMRVRDALVYVTQKARSFGGIDLAVRYNPAVRRTVTHAMLACRSGDPQRRAEVVNRLTTTIIRRARETRYGRNFGDTLEAWPILAKSQVRQDPSALVIPGSVRVPATTGGTTGYPLPLYHSLRGIAAEQVFLDDLLSPHGLSWARARIAVLRGDAVKRVDDRQPPFARISHGGRRLILSSPHLTHATLDWFLQRVDAFKPDLLYSMPTMLANLLMLLAQTGRKLHVPLVLCSSECLDAKLYSRVQSELGAHVIDYYGQTERSAFAVRTGEEEWRFEPAYGRVELLTSPADEIVDGRRHVPIVATGYWSDSQPLIRYYTGDYAVVPASNHSDLTAIAMGDQPFFGIAGRDDEYVFTPDGRRIAALNHLPREVRNVLQVQVIQDALDHLLIRILATPQFGCEDQARLLANARAKVPACMKIEITPVDHLETTPQGKAPFILRRVTAPLPG
jgi:phenylacetate-CoA ligase